MSFIPLCSLLLTKPVRHALDFLCMFQIALSSHSFHCNSPVSAGWWKLFLQNAKWLSFSMAHPAEVKLAQAHLFNRHIIKSCFQYWLFYNVRHALHKIFIINGVFFVVTLNATLANLKAGRLPGRGIHGSLVRGFFLQLPQG